MNDPADYTTTIATLDMPFLQGEGPFRGFADQAFAQQLATGIVFSVNNAIHPLCRIAAEDLQIHLQQQQEWTHNFGLSSDTQGQVIGKMFGVLVVAHNNEIGYLAAFSGKLANGNYHSRFVPPIFDGMEPGGFLAVGMKRITGINTEIAALAGTSSPEATAQIQQLKAARKALSNGLQQQIFNEYNFINQAGAYKNLLDIFTPHGYRQPPAGAGECAAPKLLQYAFQQNMRPLALAEFWWGLSPKSATWQHKHFYAPCKEKCAPILSFMLDNY
ncbi:tRNA pseudouridine32 synthase / 23S rRNA pseudouridine746 synthase [Chitinophaga skermanii]|uniref:tRNA pseudouridine32 synthase / 23S rRNA pseudouridine746 synthase n=1 Tax=Chitinophaga skermanii TaxID=331697 RepID=A0A327QXY1_9BACT|nr:pseudouridylate synthase [Chitinophaga skermanii]RAJ08243.1 tRNA pseudouridine32 synthase / 23S rRNA pseudouridine746 synthase [Chitinophaga skermanii]